MATQYKRPTVPGQRPSVGNGISQKTDEQPKLSIEQLQDKVAVVDKLARNAFNTFHDKMLALYGIAWPIQTYAANRFWKRFIELGEILYENKWDPEEYVDYVISNLTKNHISLTPKDLLNKNAIESFRLKSDDSIDPIQEWNYCITQLLQYEKTSTELKILDSPVTPFPAWFRVIYPEVLDKELLENWGKVACLEITKNHKLRKFLAQKVPKRIEELSNLWGGFSQIKGGKL
jgi:hypothetical protein